MSGIRADQLVAATAIAFLLATAGSSFADPANNDTAATSATSSPAATPVPAATQTAPAAAQTTAPATPSATDTPKPDQAAGATTAPAASSATPAAAPTPAAATETPAAAPSAATANPPAAATPQTAAAPAPAPGPDDAIAAQLHDLTNGKFDRIIGNRNARNQIDAFYSGRNYKPLWITDGKANARADAAIAYLGHVDADGLFPSDYPVPNFASAATPADLADAEMRLTTSIITYARHASIGRVAWSRVSGDIEYTIKAPEPADVLASIVDAKDVATALDSYEPHTPGYLALKAKLADIRAGKLEKDVKKQIASGPVLKVGMQDDRVPELRDRLGVHGDGSTFDKALADAVKKYQQSNQIAATGTLTAATVEALNGKQPDHIEDVVIANMERWRWMPHELPDTYVIVNLPDFSLRVMHDGKPLWTTRIVIGKPEMPTPIMTAEMKFITVNPTWNVPPSIVNHEYLPALQQDPTVLERMGLKVEHNQDGSVHIYQPPGDGNALGRIRFNFPNKFLVYQHDTPDKYLFARSERAFSHGCMRVQDPAHYAEVLLSLVRPNDGYTEERIKKMFGPSEVNIDFPTFIPVNLTYQTAFVDDSGKLEFRGDVYGRDRALIAILKGDRKDADMPVEHKEDISHREVLAMPDQPSLFGSNSRSFFGGGASYYPNGGGAGSASGSGNFFSRLFGGFNSAPPPPKPPRKVASHAKKVSSSSTTIER